MASSSAKGGHVPEEEREEKLDPSRQHELEMLLAKDDGEIDWAEVRAYAGIPGCTPLKGLKAELKAGGVTVLHQFAHQGECYLISWVLKLCMERKYRAPPVESLVNASSDTGRTPLHFACDANQGRAVRLLVQAGADPNRQTLSGQNCAHFCARSNALDALQELLYLCGGSDGKTGIYLDIDHEDQSRQTPLSLAKSGSVRRALTKYKAKLGKWKEKARLQDALVRIFGLFDESKDGFIQPEEFVETQALLAKGMANTEDVDDLFGRSSSGVLDLDEKAIADAFEEADKNHDGRISFSEFQEAHESLVEVMGRPLREVLLNLHDIEEQCKKAREEHGVQLAALTPRGQELKKKRLDRLIENA